MTKTAPEQLQQDIEEYKKLLKQALRPNVRQFLSTHIAKLQEELPKPDPAKEELSFPAAVTENKPKSNNVYTVQIKNYAFDENLTSAKVYVNLKDIETLPADQITCEFTETSFNFTAKNLNSRNHQLKINTLCNEIKPSESSFKVKKGEFVIILKKATKGLTWNLLTAAAKDKKEKHDEKFKDTAAESKNDPQAGMMSMMKKMYDEGDDDMKRMIKKTWSESQDKKGGMGMGGMPGM